MTTRKERRAEKFGHRSRYYADLVKNSYHKYCEFSIQQDINDAHKEYAADIREARIDARFSGEEYKLEDVFQFRSALWEGFV